MALWRVHVELEDRPGRLGELAAAVGAAGCNILSVHVVGEPTDSGSVTDELLVRVPEGIDPSVLIMAAAQRAGPLHPARAGGRDGALGSGHHRPGPGPDGRRGPGQCTARRRDPAARPPRRPRGGAGTRPAHAPAAGRRPAPAARPGLAVHRDGALPGGGAARAGRPAVAGGSRARADARHDAAAARRLRGAAARGGAVGRPARRRTARSLLARVAPRAVPQPDPRASTPTSCARWSTRPAGARCSR